MTATERLAEINARAEAATEGPWAHWNPADGPSHMEIGGKVAWKSLRTGSQYGDDEKIPHWADAAFIAHARTDVPALVAALEAVLEVHQHFEYSDSRGDGAGCNECRYDDGSHMEYPCPTVEAINEALGNVVH